MLEIVISMVETDQNSSPNIDLSDACYLIKATLNMAADEKSLERWSQLAF